MNTRWAQALSQATDPVTGKVDRAALYAALCLSPDDPMAVAVEAIFEAKGIVGEFDEAGRSFAAQLTKLIEEHAKQTTESAASLRLLASAITADRKKTEAVANTAAAQITDSVAQIAAIAQRIEEQAKRKTAVVWAWLLGGVVIGLIISFSLLFFK